MVYEDLVVRWLWLAGVWRLVSVVIVIGRCMKTRYCKHCDWQVYEDSLVWWLWLAGVWRLSGVAAVLYEAAWWAMSPWWSPADSGSQLYQRAVDEQDWQPATWTAVVWPAGWWRPQETRSSRRCRQGYVCTGETSHPTLDVEERRRGASLPASSILKKYDTVLRSNF